MISSGKDKAFDGLLIFLVALLSILCLLPMIYLIAVSLSSSAAVISRSVFLLPVETNFGAYEAVFSDKGIVNSMIFTVWLTILCAACSMLITIFAAYPLTKRKLKGRNFFLVMIVITMYFSGGLIPEYLLVKNIGLTDKVAALVLPYMLSAFNLIVLKSFFSGIPESFEESAFLDGASHITILFKIILPLSKAAIATLTLFYAVGRWNGFQDALVFISKPNLYPLQLKLYMLVYNNQMSEVAIVEGSSSAAIPSENLKAAAVMLATIPIVLVYPFLQRHFISGVTIGAIKG
ncbi:MAG TPA: carbohydrate ABC transporter permease [Clostridia bacterium]|nr:carbohydrate ABC transporter permease [Clostridia bacterium]